MADLKIHRPEDEDDGLSYLHDVDLFDAVYWAVVIGFCAFLAVAVLAALSAAAPAPFAKAERRPEKFPSPPEHCLMDWASIEYRTQFRPDGTYQAEYFWQGELQHCWRGTWRLEKADGRLHLKIRETTDPALQDGWLDQDIACRDIAPEGVWQGVLCAGGQDSESVIRLVPHRPKATD